MAIITEEKISLSELLIFCQIEQYIANLKQDMLSYPYNDKITKDLKLQILTLEQLKQNINTKVYNNKLKFMEDSEYND